MAVASGVVTTQIFEAAVGAAVRAPSMYNSQPWRFRLAGNSIEAYLDPAQRLAVGDPHDWAGRIALGAAVTNLRLALAVNGLLSQPRIRTAGGVHVTIDIGDPVMVSPADHALYEAIERRHSNRTPFASTAVPPDARAHMADAAVSAGCWLEFAADRERVSLLAEIVRTADDRLRADASYVAEMKRWIGRDPGDPLGIDLVAAGIAPADQDLLAMRDYGGRNRGEGRDFESDPLLAVLGTTGSSPYDDVLAGMALEMVLLTVTSDGLAASMLSQPMEVPQERQRLQEALTHYGSPQMLIRVGYGGPGMPTTRRPITDVIDR